MQLDKDDDDTGHSDEKIAMLHYFGQLYANKAMTLCAFS